MHNNPITHHNRQHNLILCLSPHILPVQTYLHNPALQILLILANSDEGDYWLYLGVV